MNSKEILKRLEEIEARAEKATPGPWIHTCDAMTGVDPGMIRRTMEGPPLAQVIFGSENIEADGEFIAHSREDILQLCKVVRQLVAQLEEVEAQCAAMRSYIDKLEDALVWCTAADDFAPNGKAREGFEKIVLPLLDQIGKFDSQDAGRKLMSRFHKLEAVAEAAREYLHDIDASALNQPTVYQYEPGEDKSWRLRKALAALEGENNVDY